MYLKFDLAGPVLRDWVATIAFKRKLLRLWPTKIVDGIEVFNIVYIWSEWDGAYDHPKLYKALGMKLSDVTENDYDGLKTVWLELKPWVTSVFHTTSLASLATAIDANLEINEVYTAGLVYESTSEEVGIYGAPGTYGTISPAISNAGLLAQLAGGYATIPENSIGIDDHLLDEAGNPYSIPQSGNVYLFAALADRDEVVFARTFRVTRRTVIDVTPTDDIYEGSAGIQTQLKTVIAVAVTYTRKTTAHDGLGTYMFNSIQEKIDALQSVIDLQNDARGRAYTTQIQTPVGAGLVSSQIGRVSQFMEPLLNTDIVYSPTPPSIVGNVNVTPPRYIKVDGVRGMTGREFVKFFGKAFGTGYEKEDVGWIVRVVNVIIVFAAFIFAIPSAGASLTLAAVTVTSAIAVGVAVQYAFGMFLQAVGNVAGAMYTFKMTTFLGNISKVLGYITMIYGAFTSITSGFLSTVASSGVKFTIGGAFKVLNVVSSWVRAGVNMYYEFTDPNYSDQLEAKEKLIADQESAMTDYTSPKSMDLIQQNFDNYEWAEVNAVSDYIPYQLTEGKIEHATSKYY